MTNAHRDRQVVSETLGGYTAGDAVAVRGDGFIATGVIDTVNNEGEVSSGEVLLSIDDPVVWRLVDANAEEKKLDHGPPIEYRYDDNNGKGGPGDWDGPKVIVVNGDKNSHRVLRLPEPVFDGEGVRYYITREAGSVTDISIGPIADPQTLLRDDERPPTCQEVNHD